MRRAAAATLVWLIVLSGTLHDAVAETHEIDGAATQPEYVEVTAGETLKAKTGTAVSCDQGIKLDTPLEAKDEPQLIECEAGGKLVARVVIQPKKGTAYRVGTAGTKTVNVKAKDKAWAVFVNETTGALDAKCGSTDLAVDPGKMGFLEVEVDAKQSVACTLGDLNSHGLKSTFTMENDVVATATTACEERTPTGKQIEELAAQYCKSDKKTKRICVDVRGRFLGKVPDLDDKDDVEVILIGAKDKADRYVLRVTNKRTQLAGSGKGKVVQITDSAPIEPIKRWRLKVRGAGNLEIAVEYTPPKECTADGPLTRTSTIEVDGEILFRLGVAVGYIGLKSRSFVIDDSDDGIARIVQNDRSGVDLMATLTAYPYGIIHEKLTWGFVAGASIADFTDRLLLGVTLEWPSRFGLSAGAVVNLVPDLDGELVAGQPFDGTSIPTGTTAELTYFVGVNIDADLFAAAFGALKRDDD